MNIPGTRCEQEAEFNQGPIGRRLKFWGFPGDPGFEDLRHGSIYQAAMRDRLYRACAGRGGTFVEVGAHIGGTTLHAAQIFSRVIAFEPCRTSRECLQQNLEFNKIRNVTVRPEAVSSAVCEADLYLYPRENAVGNSLTESVVRPGAPSERVKVITLNSLGNCQCGMLHIDAEGHDIFVLYGAGEFLDAQVTHPVISMEFSPQMMLRTGVSATDLVSWCRSHGYRPYVDAGNNWAPVSFAVLEELYRVWSNSCCGWEDIILVPDGETFGGMFPNWVE